MKILIFSLAYMFMFGECRVICSLLTESDFLLLDFGSFSQIISEAQKKEKRIWKNWKKGLILLQRGVFIPIPVPFLAPVPQKGHPLTWPCPGSGVPLEP